MGHLGPLKQSYGQHHPCVIENQKSLKYCPSQSSSFVLTSRGTQLVARQCNICTCSLQSSRYCSQDLAGVLREIWDLKGYCWHLYSICQLPLLNVFSNLAGDTIFNPKNTGPGPYRSCYYVQPRLTGKMSCLWGYFCKIVKRPVSGTNSALHFFLSWVWMWHCFITLNVVRIMAVH